MAGKASAEDVMRNMLETALPDASDDAVAAAAGVVTVVSKRDVTAADAEAMRGLLHMLGVEAEAVGSAGAPPQRAGARGASPQEASQPLNEVFFLTVAETAAKMRVSKMEVYKLVHAGQLPAIRVGRSFRVPDSAIHEYMRAHVK